MENNYMDLNNKSLQNITNTGEPVTEQAPAPPTTNETPTPGTTNITAEIGTAATDTSETPEAASTAPTPEIAASETPASTATIDTDTTPVSTGEPVNQAPAPGTTETPEATASETPAPDSTAPETTSEAPTSATLPAGYLTDGSMVDADGVMRSEYIGEYAQELAQRLKPLKASTFQRAFLTKAKEANKKKVPYSVKKNCAQGMVIAALKLVSRKQDPAPRVLLDMIRAATATVVDDSTFSVLYMYLDAVYTFMLGN